MIKLRHVAGDAALGKQVEAHRDRYVYSAAPWDMAAALDLRRQQLKQLVEHGTVNAKLSPGGVVDIEYAIQYLQLMHGHRHAVLRTPNAMQALAGLVECGVVSRQNGENLRKGVPVYPDADRRTAHGSRPCQGFGPSARRFR